MNKYILNDKGEPVIEKDLLKWGKWFEGSGDKRKVASTTINDYFVSTVFLGLDYNWGDGEPLLYETMVFDNLPKRREAHEEIVRYSTREQALKGHEEMVNKLIIKKKKK